MRAFLLGALLCQLATATGPTLDFYPQKLSNGGVIAVRVQAPAGTEIPADAALQFADDSSVLFDCPSSEPAAKGMKCALIAVPIDTKKGSHEAVLSWTENGNRRTQALSFPVKLLKVTTTTLKVDPDRVNPTEAELKRAEQERAETKAIYAASNPTPLWQGKLVFPTADHVTGPFGHKRMFNGQLKSVHMGVDLRASTGTPIGAAGAGKVVLAKELFFGGNTVILDHGAGLFTSYGHLSEIKVTVGQMVKPGDPLGAAGATGRVTGPHLHWGARLNGVPVDPRSLLQAFNHFWGR